MQAQGFSHWFSQLEEHATLCNERRMVVLCGSEAWALSLLKTVDSIATALKHDEKQPTKATITATNCLIYGDSSVFPPTIEKKRYRDKLGSESNYLIFADSQFSVDAFAALSGTLIAGGILILVVSDINKQRRSSLFLQRLFVMLQENSSHCFIEESQECLPFLKDKHVENSQQEKQKIYPFACLTAEQLNAVKAINKVVTGHRKRPLVLTADRGRGKSSALAIACAQILKSNQNNNFHIVITAPDKQALTVFFFQLAKSLPHTKPQQHCLYFGSSSLSFIAIDQFIKQPVKANLVMVDEAAAIPVYLLEQLLKKNSRMVFSSTVHGYEGAGRGFTLKFQKILTRLCPHWKKLHIKQPIRWREHDPLEQFVFDVCLLNTELPVLSDNEVKNLLAPTEHKESSLFIFKVFDAQTLASNEALLQQIFAMLITAHYQTKPSDLQLLLDNPQVQIACLFSQHNQETLIAVTLLMNEGANNGVHQTDIIAIKRSQQRLRNQFLPQSLLSHCSVEEAFDYSYLRIMRIAVHPEIQLQGIGSHFIREIEVFAEKQDIDFVGSSFGANTKLLSFWLKANYHTVRIGFTKDKASGEHSALMIKGLNSNAQLQQNKISDEFYRSFDYLLIEEYHSLSTRMVYLLLSRQKRENLIALSTKDIANVRAFSSGERLYSSCAYSLYLWLKHDLLSCQLSDSSNSEHNRLMLVARLIQKYSCELVCQQYGLTGKKMLNQHIKDYVLSRLNNTTC